MQLARTVRVAVNEIYAAWTLLIRKFKGPIMEHTTGTTIVTSNTHVTMNWGAIFGGWLVAMGIAFLIYVGGLAVGFDGFDPYDAAATSTAIWIILTWAVSLFIGGMFASWFDGKADQTVGTLHGITVWGLSVTASALLFMVRMTHVIHGGAAAEHAARDSYSATAMGIAFLSIFIALVVAALGGWLGASHIHKVHHMRRYETPIERPM
jgi:hypothetical protein